MKGILVTGANGFLGASLLEALVASEEYRVFALVSTSARTNKIKHLVPNVEIFYSDEVELKEIFEKNKIDTVVHTATSQKRSKPSPSKLIETNILFTLRLLEESIAGGVAMFINVNTMLPKYANDYALSKYQASEWFGYLAQKIKIIDVALELFFGAKEDNGQFIKSKILEMLEHKASIPLTGGVQKRDIVYIKDVVEAFMTIIKNSDYIMGNTRFEVGSGKPIAVKEIVELIHKTTQSKSYLDFGAIDYPENMPLEFCADISLLEQFGWSPKYSLQEGLIETINEIKGLR